jgi:triphosphatase
VDFTLALSAENAARLLRLPVVKEARSGRSRGQATRIVWHDTLDRSLAADGLVLAEQRGSWRLERHAPAETEPWPPTTDHRLIEEASRIEALIHALPAHSPPDAMTPVAAFDGRRTVLPLTVDGQPVSLTLLQGVLRAVAAERTCARLSLAGPASQVRTLALALGETVSLTVPVESLATEAMRLADGTAPAVRPSGARRSGAPSLPADGISVAAAFAHIIGHLADVMRYLAPSAADTGADPEAVHQMRVAVRRARSAFALFPAEAENPAWKNCAEGLRHLSRMLGPARDWDVFMTETEPSVEAGLPGQSALRALSRGGARRRRAARQALSEYLSGPAFRSLCLELACLAAAEPPEPDPSPDPNPDPNPDPLAPTLREFAAATLRKRWKKVMRAGKTLDALDDAALHGLRLKAKRLRYAAEFFAPLFPEKPATRFIRRLAVLQDRMGLFNDTTVAAALLRELGAKPSYAAGLVLGFTAARGARARPKITAAWRKFRGRDPFWE